MSTEKKLHTSDIIEECGMAFYERGKDYFRSGAVRHFAIKSEGALFTQVNAAVDGSAANPYKQNIRLTWRSDYRSANIEGTCSCPIGFNCKHVAAVCLYFQSLSDPDSAQTSDTDCFQWLESFGARRPKSADGEPQEFLAYLLKPGRTKYSLAVELLITKKRKAGGFSKGRKMAIQNLRFTVGYYPYIQKEDTEIAKILGVLDNSSGGESILTGIVGGLALAKMINTGRLFWDNLEGQPLKQGPARPIHFTWLPAENGEFRLQTSIEPGADPVLVEPPHYLDVLEGLIGVFSNPVTLDQLAHYLAAPPVPAKVADEFSHRLTVEHPELRIPPPRKVDLTEIRDVRPIPQLILYGEANTVQKYIHYLTLNFRYGGYLLSGFDTGEYGVVKAQEGLIRIERMRHLEQAAITRLTEAGFSLAPGSQSQAKELLFTASAKTAVDSAARWRHFMDNELPELEREGWLVEVRNSFLLSFQNVDAWDVEISDQHTDWFEMRFNIQIDGNSIPLLPLIMPVLENYDLHALPEFLNIPAGDFRYLTVPSEKIKPVLAVLLELFGTSNLDKNGNLRIARTNAASLADMETHSYGLFAIKGGEELRKLAQKLRDFTGIENAPAPNNLRTSLRPYQQTGLNWLQFLREYRFGGILADDMGLGKTVQALAHLLLEKQSGRMKEPSLIIAPTSLLSNWRRETERFTPDLNILILQGTERKQLFYKIRDYDLIMTTYPLLPRDESTLLEHTYHYLILDEAQIVKNPSSKGAQIVRQIKSSHRLCLTGTPMENHLGELWTQFDFLMPGFLGDNASFKKNYRTPIEMFGDTEQRLRLKRRVAPFMLRRTKQQVASELPPKTEIMRSVPLYERQAALYESIRLTMEKKVRDAIALRGLSRSHITILDALLKLRQTCCDPRILPIEEAQKIGESAKLDLLMELVPELLEEGRRILIFSQFTRMIALIEDELNRQSIVYTKLTGQTQFRDEAIERFKSGEADVFLISLKAGGIGLNLTEADTVIIYDPWWNPAVEAQAADRAYRIGQDKPVFVYKLLAENTVEEKMLAMQEKKRLLAASIQGDEGNGKALQFTAEDLTALFEPL